MSNVSSEMLRGHIDTIILLSLLNSDKHTGQIKEEIESRSEGRFELKQGTFYSCLQRIVKQGYVTEYRVSTPEGRKKFYQLTEKGKVYIDENKDKWCFSRSVIDTLIQAPSEEPEVKDKRIISLPSEERAVEQPVEDEISPEDTLRIFLDGGEPSPTEQKTTEKAEEQKPIEKVELPTEKPSEAVEKSVKLGENYDIFSFMDNTQSLPLDEQRLEEERKEREKRKAEEIEKETEATATKQTEVEQLEIKEALTAPKSEPTQENTEAELSEDERIASREYKSVLAKLFPERKPPIPQEEVREMVYTEGADVNAFFHDTVTLNDEELLKLQLEAKKEKKSRKIRETKKDEPIQKPSKKDESEDKKSFLHASSRNVKYDFSDIKELAEKEGFRVRISSREARVDAGRILINKLTFHSSLTYFLILAIETLIIALTTSSIAGLSAAYYLVFGGVCALFPLTLGIRYLIAPNKKLSTLATFKNAIELIIIITLNLCLITFCCCIFLEIDFANPSMLLKYVLYPLLFLLDLPIYTFVKYLKLDNQKYFS